MLCRTRRQASNLGNVSSVAARLAFIEWKYSLERMFPATQPDICVSMEGDANDFDGFLSMVVNDDEKTRHVAPGLGDDSSTSLVRSPEERPEPGSDTIARGQTRYFDLSSNALSPTYTAQCRVLADTLMARYFQFATRKIVSVVTKGQEAPLRYAALMCEGKCAFVFCGDKI